MCLTTPGFSIRFLWRFIWSWGAADSYCPILYCLTSQDHSSSQAASVASHDTQVAMRASAGEGRRAADRSICFCTGYLAGVEAMWPYSEVGNWWWVTADPTPTPPLPPVPECWIAGKQQTHSSLATGAPSGVHTAGAAMVLLQCRQLWLTIGIGGVLQRHLQQSHRQYERIAHIGFLESGS